MIVLPSADVENLRRLADWAELATWIDGSLSLADVADVLHGAGLAGYARREYFVGDEAFEEEEAFSDEESAYRLGELVWEECRKRSQVLRNAYPFRVESSELCLRESDPAHSAGYAMMLLVDIGFHYGQEDLIEANSESGRLFEKIVEASYRGLLGGPCSRFGWPPEPGWDTAVEDRLRTLGQVLGLTTENLEDKTEGRDKDMGLDVVGLANLYDSSEGSVAVITQCATGRSTWKQKRGEPAENAWRDIYQWRASLIKGIAVPWRLEGAWGYRRTHRHFDAVVFDRPRLLAGHPDRYLDATVRAAIYAWTTTRVAELPVL